MSTKWMTREDYDYYQGGTYIGYGPYYYRKNKIQSFDGIVGSTKVDGLDNDGRADYFEKDVCRVESQESLPLLLAAPEMLEALKAARRMLENIFKSGDLAPYNYKTDTDYLFITDTIKRAEHG